MAEDADISVTKAWDITKGNREIVIAVLDDGFDLSHPDLSGIDKIKHPRDFVDGGYDPNPGNYGFHGTPCAGLAIGELNEEGIVGVAPACSFMPVRIPFGADPDLLHEIFDYVGKRAHIISCSWGPPPVYAPLHSLVHDKITELAESGGPDGKGCTIIFAAHNYNAPLHDEKNEHGVKYLMGNKIYEHKDPILNGNAIHPNVITVSSSTSLNKKAAYSNWGKEITLTAPSNNYHPLDFSVKLKGRGITTADNFKVGQHFSPNSRYTNLFGGTSCSAPIVAGVVGLMLSANSNLTAYQIRQILIETATKIEDDARDIVLGHKKGTYDENKHSEWFGYGKINAHKAVQKAVDLLPFSETDEEEDSEISLEPDVEIIEFRKIKLQKNDGEIPKLALKSHIKSNLKGDDDTQIFKVVIGKKLLIEMNASEDTDFDVYLKKDELPSKQKYDARGITETSKEKVVFDNLEAGTYYIMVSSFRGRGDFELKLNLE